jgi:hypothetical protein
MKSIFSMIGMVMPKHSEPKKGSACLSPSQDPVTLADFRRFHASKAPTAKDAHRAFGGIKLRK